jgi:hypothetical protein
MDWQGYVFLAKNREVRNALPGERMVLPRSLLPELLPSQTRGQVLHVLKRALGIGPYADEFWRVVVDRYDYEMGTSNLDVGSAPAEISVDYFIRQPHDVEALDLVALALLVAQWSEGNVSIGYRGDAGVVMGAEDAVKEVNRFLEEGRVPYQYERARWVHVPSGYVHQEMVRPALDALARDGFAGALEEFKRALDHARDGRTKEAATEATKALESTMKCICDARGWTYPENVTAQPLFSLLVDRGLIADWMESGFMGVVAIRNRRGAHGQGADSQPLAPYVADLAVNLAASYILVLVAAHDVQGRTK